MMQARGGQTGMAWVVLILFGAPFVGVGVWATLAGTKVVPIDPGNLHAPHWVLAAFGLVFALAGLMVWGMGWRFFRANLRRKRALANRANDPALADYPWDPRGFTPPRWAHAAKAVGGVILLAIFLSIFNWWAFGADGPWPVKIIVGLFDMILVWAAWQAVMAIGRTLKFGPSRIEFGKFPLRPGETAVLRWLVPKGIGRVAHGTFIFRCVEEWYETSHAGKGENKTLVQEQVWAMTCRLGQQVDLRSGKTEELRFDLPPDAASTSLSNGKTVFWELVIELDLAGLDFKETYLVPVYRAG